MQVLFVLDRPGASLNCSWVLYQVWQSVPLRRPEQLIVLPASWVWTDMVHVYTTMDIAKSEPSATVPRQLLLDRLQRSTDLTLVMEYIKVR
jgi:hypothetical protein